MAVKFYADEPVYDTKKLLQSFLLFSNVSLHTTTDHCFRLT